MAIQFCALIAIGAWLGGKLDVYFGTSKPYITIFLILFFAGGYFYKLFLDLSR